MEGFENMNFFSDNPLPVYDFHTHSFLSDGILSPSELVRTAITNGYACVAVTDHVGAGEMQSVIAKLREDKKIIQKFWNICMIVGVEITHTPAGAIDELAGRAKEFGAELVVVHGETIGEPVEKGTNISAVTSKNVDILAHPGFLTVEEAETARINNVFIEISASSSAHSHTNGHVARIASECGADLLVNSDSHTDTSLLTFNRQVKVAKGAGLTEEQVYRALVENPNKLLEKIRRNFK